MTFNEFNDRYEPCFLFIYFFFIFQNRIFKGENRIAVFSENSRTKYGKIVLLGMSANGFTIFFNDILCAVENPAGFHVRSGKIWFRPDQEFGSGASLNMITFFVNVGFEKFVDSLCFRQ